jgi:hypothetical protein
MMLALLRPVRSDNAAGRAIDISLEIQTTTPEGFRYLRRRVDLAALPNIGDRISVEFCTKGVRVIGREFTLDGEVILDLGWHHFDDDEHPELSARGWKPAPIAEPCAIV